MEWNINKRVWADITIVSTACIILVIVGGKCSWFRKNLPPKYYYPKLILKFYPSLLFIKGIHKIKSRKTCLLLATRENLSNWTLFQPKKKNKSVTIIINKSGKKNRRIEINYIENTVFAFLQHHIFCKTNTDIWPERKTDIQLWRGL